LRPPQCGGRRSVSASAAATQSAHRRCTWPFGCPSPATMSASLTPDGYSRSRCANDTYRAARRSALVTRRARTARRSG